MSALAAKEGRGRVVTTSVEHPAILSLVEHLAESRGIRRISSGWTRVAAWISKPICVRSDRGPRIASVMWANNETGTIFPVALLVKMAHEAGALFHTDAVQAVGKIPIDLKSTEIDMLSLSGHKLHGPKGIGALYVRKGTKFTPLIRGGPQERRRRGGTENTPAIVGLGKAAALATTTWEERTRIRALRDRLEQGLFSRSVIAWCWAMTRTGCPTHPISRSRTSKAKPSFIT